MEDMPWIVEMSFWFLGGSIVFLILMNSPTIAHNVKKTNALNDHSDWSDEKLEARVRYLLCNESFSGRAELDAIHEIQERREEVSMRKYTMDKWNEWKDKE